MRYLYSTILFVCATLAFYYATRVFYRRNYKKKVFLAFSVTSVGSGLWSLGYSLMLATTREQDYVWMRILGCSGLFLFLIAAQILIGIISDYSLQKYTIIFVESGVAPFVLWLILHKKNYQIIHSEMGLITAFTSASVAVVYTAYVVLVAGYFVLTTIKMIDKENPKRMRTFGQKFLVVEGLILLGMIVDTVMPALGTNLNIPASTMLQFVGLCIVYYAVHALDRNRISLQNMAGYIYESLKSPVLLFDTDDRLQFANREARKMFDLGDGETETDFWKECLSIVPPEGISAATSSIEMDSLYSKRHIYCRLYINPIFDEYGDYIGYIVMVSDMTLNVKYTNELTKSKDEAQRANKAKSIFLANMSHEIRTPMNSILGFSEIALRSNVDDLAREYFKDIHDAAEVLLVTINDILDISKIESGKMELVNENYFPYKIFHEVSLIISMAASQKDLEYEMTISQEFPNQLLGDPAKIRQILINVLNNGIKYTQKGRVSLRAEFDKENSTSGIMRLIISDTGIGIKEQEIGKIFDSFQRVDLNTNKTTEGTGLGLSITKGFVELMGGTINLTSVYGEGTTFLIEIRQKIVDSSPMKQHLDEQKHRSETLRFKNLKVLAVDDSKINLKVILRILEQYGISADTAISGEESIAKCKQQQYDLVLMDQMMPVMDGVEAMKNIRELGGKYAVGGGCLVIALTANAVGGVREELMSQGFDEYISKPISRPGFEELMLRMLPEDRYEYVENI